MTENNRRSRIRDGEMGATDELSVFFETSAATMVTATAETQPITDTSTSNTRDILIITGAVCGSILFLSLLALGIRVMISRRKPKPIGLDTLQRGMGGGRAPAGEVENSRSRDTILPSIATLNSGTNHRAAVDKVDDVSTSFLISAIQRTNGPDLDVNHQQLQQLKQLEHEQQQLFLLRQIYDHQLYLQNHQQTSLVSPIQFQPLSLPLSFLNYPAQYPQQQHLQPQYSYTLSPLPVLGTSEIRVIPSVEHHTISESTSNSGTKPPPPPGPPPKNHEESS
ncbi:hypothetical protein BDR26DRAFT_871984 [Obelidium mucronatum]|nr:hypothetical protein BDR26DRAFT_871984 [Obelidium mucronatum]